MFDWKKYATDPEEKPLDRLVEGYSMTSVFRTVAFIGDSLSSGEFELVDPADGKHSYYDFYEYSWGQYIARNCGLKAYNFSKGGMTAREYLHTFAESKGFWNPELRAQAYVIALGVNDANSAKRGTGTVIGSAEDVHEDWHENPATFCGDYAAIVGRYREISPNAKFFFLTLPEGNLREDYARMNELIREMAGKTKNAYVIDLERYAPVYDDAFKKEFFLNGHMNAAGYILTARMVDSYIDYIVRHHPADFQLIGFCGKPEYDALK